MTSRIIISALIVSLLAPSVAFGQGTSVNATASTSVTASTTPKRPAPLPKLGPAIKQHIASSTTPKDGSVRDAVRTRVDAIRALIGEHKDAIAKRKAELELRVGAAKAKAGAKFDARVQNSVEVLVNKLMTTTLRLGAMADKIEGHIERLEAEGKDMSQAAALLADARADITLATEKAAAASAALEAALGATDPKAEMAKVRAAVTAAQQAIRAAHQSLVETVKSIRVNASAQVGAGASVN